MTVPGLLSTKTVVYHVVTRFGKADFTAVNSALKAADWSSVSDATDVDSAWTAWQKVFLPVVDKLIQNCKELKTEEPFCHSTNRVGHKVEKGLSSALQKATDCY